MLVLDHVSISVPDFQRARPFNAAVMAALGVAKAYDRPGALGNRIEAVCHRGE